MNTMVVSSFTRGPAGDGGRLVGQGLQVADIIEGIFDGAHAGASERPGRVWFRTPPGCTSPENPGISRGGRHTFSAEADGPDQEQGDDGPSTPARDLPGLTSGQLSAFLASGSLPAS